MARPENRKTAAAERPLARPQRKGGRSATSKADADGPVWIYGRHAVAAALQNPARRLLRAAATKNAADWLKQNAPAFPGALEDARPDAIDRLLPPGAVHQGLAALFEPLPRARLKEVCAPAAVGRPVIVLDQVTDPQNIGAIMRTAAGLGACAMVVQDRRTPPLSGALAKAAAGALEALPIVRVVNVARALEALGELGYFRAGLSGNAKTAMSALSANGASALPTAVVVGAEGAGLRQLVASSCDGLFRIEMSEAVESLNVSVAAAIALYETTRRS